MSSYYSPGGAGNRNLVTMVRIAAFGAMLLTIGSLFGTAHWLLELLTHFRVQYAVGSILLAAVAIAVQCRASSSVLVLVAVANLVPAWGYTIPGAPEVRAGTLALKIMSLNVGLRNSDYEATLALVERERPHIVG